MWLGRIDSHFAYELATGSAVKFNLRLSLLCQKFLPLPVKAVDLISGGQRDTWPRWLEELSQRFCMDNGAVSDLEMSSIPKMAWDCAGFTISCLAFESSQYLTFLPFLCISSVFFLFHVTHKPLSFSSHAALLPLSYQSQRFCLNEQLRCADQHLWVSVRFNFKLVFVSGKNTEYKKVDWATMLVPIS